MALGPLVWPLVGAAAVTAADQAVKLTILFLEPHVTVIPGFFAIRFTTNTGAAFSLFQQFPRALTVLGILILAVVIGYLWQRATTASSLEQAAVALLIGGALGNLIDRFRLGYVVDYLDVFVHVYHWPTFNLADSAIVIGVACLARTSIRGGGARQPSSAGHPGEISNL